MIRRVTTKMHTAINVDETNVNSCGPESQEIFDSSLSEEIVSSSMFLYANVLYVGVSVVVVTAL